MSKKDEMQSSLNSLVGGFIAPTQTASEKPKKEVKQEIKPKDKVDVSDDVKKNL